MRERRNTAAGLGGGNIFLSFRRIFAPGITNIVNDSFNRTSTYCFSASIPTREVTHWVKSEIDFICTRSKSVPIMCRRN